jgi:toxin-antitoxin system PIN domain toxin
MLALDVNVLVPAFRSAAPDHEAIRDWLQQAVDAPEPVGASEAVLTGALRILTHPRVFTPPTSVDSALDRLRDFTDQSGVVVLSPGPGYLDILDRLCRATGATGNLVSDAGHAATAIAHDATFITRDRDFARFPGLRWRAPG